MSKIIKLRCSKAKCESHKDTSYGFTVAMRVNEDRGTTANIQEMPACYFTCTCCGYFATAMI
jgi:hypothetical protein